jgi:hypothetical protein
VATASMHPSGMYSSAFAPIPSLELEVPPVNGGQEPAAT